MIKLFILFFLIFLFYSTSLAHKECTHQYIVREAVKLLQMQMGQGTFFGNWVGDTERQCNSNAAGMDRGKIVAGAWNEDYYDLVYLHGHPTPIVSFIKNTGILYPIAATYHSAVVSTTHFWNVDGGDNVLTNLSSKYSWLDGLVSDKLKNVPNALTKAEKYAYGTFNFMYLHPVHSSARAYYFRFDGLLNMYQNNRLWVNAYYNYIGSRIGRNFWRYLDYGNFPPTREIFSYNILGRIAHLLSDMGVPAHVHNDEHGSWSDPFEDIMRYENAPWYRKGDCEKLILTSPMITPDDTPGNPDFVERWSAKSVFYEKGGLINPYCNKPNDWTPIKFLMYTTAQIADFFPSNRVDGNEIYEDVGEINTQIDFAKALNPPTLKSQYHNISMDDLEKIRDITFPYVIRAVAGLLYWFAKETNQVTTCQDYRVLFPQSFEDVIVNGINYSWYANNLLRVKGMWDSNNSKEYYYAFGPQASNVSIKSANEISLESGFWAQSGCEIHIKIADCTECD